MAQRFSDDEIREQALAVMREYGIEPIKNIRLILDGKLHRYALEGDKHSETSGAYIIHSDGWPAGYFQNWRIGLKVKWKFDGGDIKPEDYFNSDEYKKNKKEIEAKQKQREEEEQKRHAEASERARILFEQLPEATEHPYLKKKQINPHGVRYQSATKSLVIPLRDINGKLLSIQSINEEGEKRFFFDAPLKGAFFSFNLEPLKRLSNKFKIKRYFFIIF